MDDLIYYQYPYPTHRKKMSMVNRGAQFSPFAALTGYEEAIDEEARLTYEKVLLSEDEITRINQKLNYLNEHLNIHLALSYFEKDSRKQGGSYQTYYGNIKKINIHEQYLLTSTLKVIHFENIIDIQSNDFPNYL